MVEEIRDQDHVVVCSEINLERAALYLVISVRDAKFLGVFLSYGQNDLPIDGIYLGIGIMLRDGDAEYSVPGGDVKHLYRSVFFITEFGRHLLRRWEHQRCHASGKGRPHRAFRVDSSFIGNGRPAMSDGARQIVEAALLCRPDDKISDTSQVGRRIPVEEKRSVVSERVFASLLN